MIPDSRQPIPEPAATTGWRQILAEAKDKPWLAGLLARQGAQVFRRFVYFYHRLALRPGQGQRWQRRLGMSLAGVALLLALSGSPTGASPATVISVDGTICTLADAIIAANTDTATGGCSAGSGADTIDLQVDVHLTSKLPDIASGITINGNGHTIRRAGGSDYNVLRASEAGGCDLTLNDATISGGVTGIVNAFGGKMTLNRCTISGNSADWGGGIYNVQSDVTMTIRNSTISGNSANSAAGIVNYAGATMLIIDSTISDNSAKLNCAGIGNAYGKVTLQNSSVVRNLTEGPGGGICNVDSSTVLVRNSTISGNSAGTSGGGISNASEGVAEVSNSLVAAQTGGSDCSGRVTSLGYNVSGDASCGFTATGDQQNLTSEQLKLGPLALNGGTTKTKALAPGSLAIDRIPSGTNGCGTEVTADQRGEPRSADGDKDEVAACDVGAYELQALTATIWLPLMLHQP